MASGRSSPRSASVRALIGRHLWCGEPVGDVRPPPHCSTVPGALEASQTDRPEATFVDRCATGRLPQAFPDSFVDCKPLTSHALAYFPERVFHDAPATYRGR